MYIIYDIIIDIVFSSDDEVMFEGYLMYFGIVEVVWWFFNYEL